MTEHPPFKVSPSCRAEASDDGVVIEPVVLVVDETMPATARWAFTIEGAQALIDSLRDAMFQAPQVAERMAKEIRRGGTGLPPG